jgi:serine/threonine protein phosphatase PrpC
MAAKALPFPVDPSADMPPLLAGRFRARERLDARDGFERWIVDDKLSSAQVILLSEPHAAGPASRSSGPSWPSLAWEEDLRQRAGPVGLPPILDRFTAIGRDFLVIEIPAGVTLWEVWDDSAFGAPERFGWLGQLTDLLRALHRAGAILEALRPEQVRISPLGQVLLDPTVVLVPLPTPRDAPVRPSLVSAPELIDGQGIDARADLYCVGTVLYALELGHELTELDFRGRGDPYPFLDRFPDAHPLLGRLLGKTLARYREQRFPTVGGNDPSGFDELIGTLVEAQRTLGRVRLDLAAWTTTGMVRAGNEDALAVVHATELRDGTQEEYALILAADGMGGSAAGEVAAALTIQSLRQRLLHEAPFRGLTDEPGLPRMIADRAMIRRRLTEALADANRLVYRSAREGEGRRGMGCTAEAVYLDGRQIVVGHVGDSRTYLLHRGRLTQLTRDHTMVARMVELGHLTVDQAASHPRRGELRQAIGGRAEVRPEISAAALAPGDWVVVCTDGLTGCLRPEVIQEVLEQAPSADQAARRLVNRANQLHANDNVSVVVVRAT